MMRKCLLWMLLGFLCSPALAQAPTQLTPKEQALFEAALEGGLESIQVLASEGVALDTVDSQKRNALMWAAFNGHTEVVAYLLSGTATEMEKR